MGAEKRRLRLPLQNFEVEKAVLEHALTEGRRLGLPARHVESLVRILVETSVEAQERDRARAEGSGPRSALVVGGAGRMGAWFTAFLEGQGHRVCVLDPRAAPEAAPKPGETFDLVVVATPPSTLAKVLEESLPWCRPDGLLLDIASIKGPAAAVLSHLARGGRKVASLHPLFGPGAETLAGRTVLVMDCGSPEAARAAAQLFASTAARIEQVRLLEHDRLMGEVLGLSHAASLAFNEALQRGGFPFARLEAAASTTFRRQSELSREVAAENPDLYFEIQTLNAASEAVLARLEGAASDLRRLVAAGDRKGFQALMERAAAYYGSGVTVRSR